MDACPPLEDIAAFLDGTLPPEERARITEHLARCESCYEIFVGAVHFQEDIGKGDVPHLPLTDFNGYLDGTLSPEERARITEHLAQCESCYEVFAGAAHFELEEGSSAEDTGGRGVLPFPLEGRESQVEAEPVPAKSVALPPPARRRTLRWLPLAATVVLAAGLGWAGWRFFFSPPEITLAGVIAPIEKKARTLEDVLYENTFRGLTNSSLSLSSSPAAVMVGVHALDLRLSVQANDWEATASRLQELAIELQDTHAFPELSERCSAESKRMETPEALERFRPELPALERELQEGFQGSIPFQFGLWSEAGRLAAKVESPEFFTRRDNRRFLSHARKVLPEEFDAELRMFVQDDLKAIERTWDQGALSREDYKKVAIHFESIIKQIDDYEEGP